MNEDMMAFCGTYCETCDWKEKMNCKGCKGHMSNVFWGKCLVASCAIEKKLNHCGECDELPCTLLQEAFDHPEHGDNGERLINLKKWAREEE
ncbi:MAG: DUF3795 domain-containing protein [Alkaliphilus sp.]